MLTKSLFAFLLSSSPAIGYAFVDQDLQQPLGMWHPLSTTIADDTKSAHSESAPSYRTDLIALHKSLIDISSVTGTEHDVGQFLVDYFASKSWKSEIEVLPAKPNTPKGKDRFNVYSWPGSAKKHPNPKVLVTSHIDVVPPHIPYSISDEAGKVTKDTVIAGRGSVDAKGSVATQLTALEELLASGEVDAEDVMVLYVVGEETGGDGMREFSNKSGYGFKAAIFGEPTELKLACGHKGAMVCTVSAKGKAGHSGYPWLGKSANEVLMRGLVKILDTDVGTSEKYGNTTINVGTLQGGVAGNVIAEHASALVVGRVALQPQESGHFEVQKKMREILASVDEDISMECETGSGVVPCDCDVDGFEDIVVNYGTDVPNLKGNHTRYLYGPGTILVAHSDDEAVTVGDLETAVEGFKKLILQALKA